VLVGLPTGAVRESTDRVWSAIANSNFKPPQLKATINLAPGHLRKEGPLYDLPIALALLLATGQLRTGVIRDFMVAGELGLSGQTRPVRGGLALALCARRLGKTGMLLPRRTADEAALVRGLDVYPVESLDHACAFLEGRAPIEALRRPPWERLAAARAEAETLDFSEVKSQHTLRRAVEVAVAGGHNLLIIGPPGSGKSMVAKRIPGIMPDLDEDEYLEILQIYSAGGQTLDGLPPPVRPFRSPHHTISDVGLIGGGTIPGPGEISLAHNGVLFLDELPEFRRSALEVLRQPLEDATVTISRSAGRVTLPARCMLVAAMNPTPCGGGGAALRSTPAQVQRYRARISGPLLDRIDIHVEAPALQVDELGNCVAGETSAAIRDRVAAARDLQRRRFAGEAAGCRLNAAMSPTLLRRHCALNASQHGIMRSAMERIQLSARAYDRILKVARTIADLAGAGVIGDPHLLEAIQYRSLDRGVLF
jgi:magnesium chelatase family protein